MSNTPTQLESNLLKDISALFPSISSNDTSSALFELSRQDPRVLKSEIKKLENFLYIGGEALKLQESEKEVAISLTQPLKASL
jgi:hypothetical protein